MSVDRFMLYHFASTTELDLNLVGDSFYLKTCQRQLIISLGEHTDFEQHPNLLSKLSNGAAYIFLLEIITGLKSKLVAENEITGQFKTAYKAYCKQQMRCTKVMRLVEKLFLDSKKIRHKHLNGLGQKSYAYITRKLIQEKNRPQKVLILGSGQLAQELVGQLNKKTDVYVCARNTERLELFKSKYSCLTLSWESRHTNMENFDTVINTIAQPLESPPLIAQETLENWWSRSVEDFYFIDLADKVYVPKSLREQSSYIDLEHIFELGADHDKKREQVIQTTKHFIQKIAQRRFGHFHLPEEPVLADCPLLYA